MATGLNVRAMVMAQLPNQGLAAILSVYGNASFHNVYVSCRAVVPGRLQPGTDVSGIRRAPAWAADDSPEPPRSTGGDEGRPVRGIRKRDASLRPGIGRLFRRQETQVQLPTRSARDGLSTGMLA